jgi:hypothetical protein
MTSAIRVTTLTTLAFFLGCGLACAQTAGPDEGVAPNGGVSQTLALTAAQKSAIYNAIIKEKVRPSGARIAVAVGAPVPISVELGDLPGEAAVGDSGVNLLKYAMVENDIVVVDPVTMRVVGIIHGGARQ